MTAAFFDDLAKRGQEPLLGRVRAKVRFDIADKGKTERWLLSIQDGSLAVSRGDGEADCIIQADKAEFERIASGTRNPMAAVLRGTLTMEGNLRLLIRIQRLFSAHVGMPEATGPRSMGKRRS